MTLSDHLLVDQRVELALDAQADRMSRNISSETRFKPFPQA